MEKKVGERFKKQAHVLMIHIHALCQRKAGKCVATTKYLANIIGKSERQTYYYLKYLRDTNQISVVTSDVKRNTNHRIRLLFYQTRTIQSYHKDPEGYKEVNDAFFHSNPLKIKDISEKFKLNHTLSDKLLDKKGEPLPPERVGKVTPEYFAKRVSEVKNDPRVKAASITHFVPRIEEVVETMPLEVVEAYKFINTPSKLDEMSLLNLVSYINSKPLSEKTKEEKDLVIYFLKINEPSVDVTWESNVELKVETPDIDFSDDEPEEGDELNWFKRQSEKVKPVEEKEDKLPNQFKLKVDLKLKPWWRSNEE